MGSHLRPFLVFSNVAIVALLGCFVTSSALAQAQTANNKTTVPHARTLGALEAFGKNAPPLATSPEALARLTVSPMSFSGGSSLTVISPQAWSSLSNLVEISLEQTHQRLTNLLGTLPPVLTSVRLMTSTAFTHATGAPEWTNALYYRGQILIPINPEQQRDHDGISRSVRHEYTHAVINTLSKGRAPGWLDEGIAQWIEGEENPVLKPALYEWLSENDPIPLSALQGGFTRLNTDTVPAAYAQSLLSATVVINTYGFAGIRTFFDALREGGSQDEAMRVAFDVSAAEFEGRLQRTLRSWHTQQEQALHPIRRIAHTAKSSTDIW